MKAHSNLGLNSLTADQLLELTLEVAAEWADRDPHLRNLAQATVTGEAERLAVKRTAQHEANVAVLNVYFAAVRDESLKEARELAAKGEISLLTPAQHARILVESTLEAKIKLIDESVQAILSGKLAKKPGVTVQPDVNPAAYVEYDPQKGVPMYPVPPQPVLRQPPVPPAPQLKPRRKSGGIW